MNESNAEWLVKFIGIISAVFFLTVKILGPVFEWIKNQASVGFAIIALVIFFWWLAQSHDKKVKKVRK